MYLFIYFFNSLIFLFCLLAYRFVQLISICSIEIGNDINLSKNNCECITNIFYVQFYDYLKKKYKAILTSSQDPILAWEFNINYNINKKNIKKEKKTYCSFNARQFIIFSRFFHNFHSVRTLIVL